MGEEEELTGHADTHRAGQPLSAHCGDRQDLAPWAFVRGRRAPLELQMWRGLFLEAGRGWQRPLLYRWIAVTSVGVLVWLGPWLLEPRGALGTGLGAVWAASLRLSLSAASICSWQARRQSTSVPVIPASSSVSSSPDKEQAPRPCTAAPMLPVAIMDGGYMAKV